MKNLINKTINMAEDYIEENYPAYGAKFLLHPIWLAGYNAANTVCSTQNVDAKHIETYVKGQIEKYPNAPIQTGINSWLNGYDTAIQSQSIQPTGSVREIAANLYPHTLTESGMDTTAKRKAWLASVKWREQHPVYNSAAKNLPVVCSTGWTDAQVDDLINWLVTEKHFRKLADREVILPTIDLIREYKRSHPVQQVSPIVGWADADMKNAFEYYRYRVFPHNLSFEDFIADYKLTHAPVQLSDISEKALDDLCVAVDANGYNRGSVMTRRLYNNRIEEMRLYLDDYGVNSVHHYSQIVDKFNETFPKQDNMSGADNIADKLEQMQGAYEVIRSAADMLADRVEEMRQWLVLAKADAIKNFNIDNSKVASAVMDNAHAAIVKFNELIPTQK